jgi:hypothetical protein
MKTINEQCNQKKKVENLKNFPFESFEQLNNNIIFKKAFIRLPRNVALNWIIKGIYTTTSQRAFALFIVLSSYIIGISYIIYVLMFESWFFLFAIPFLVLSYVIFDPGNKVPLGPIRSGLILFTFLGFAYSIISETSWLIAITLSLVLLWYVQRSIYKYALSSLTKACCKHEDLLCSLWEEDSLVIKLSTGEYYGSTWKNEYGREIYY